MLDSIDCILLIKCILRKSALSSIQYLLFTAKIHHVIYNELPIPALIIVPFKALKIIDE